MKEKWMRKNGIYLFTAIALLFVVGGFYFLKLFVAGEGEDMSGMLLTLIPIIIMYALFADMVLRGR